MTEREKMLRGELYDAADAALVAGRARARSLLQRYNTTRDVETLRELLGALVASSIIEPPFFCDYDEQILLGENVFVNMNCVFLDPAAIAIGARRGIRVG